MEDHHNEKPVATAEVPDDPENGVGADDHGYNKQVDDDQD